ncbi:hypothetical protein SLEP1_g24618 [Rubroshorea leprosula]|uniref:DUF659 domain-containing protein n=1 Tax=Rubroshorea leprosula TaxID=152421 RepID=A0AAV5JG76_9ROSI|nr:hypothetical protein SLEP1_g24618 [Rubroshorea leprosula]
MESGSTTNSSRSKTSRSDDEIGWKYNKLQDPNNSSRVVCNFCNKVTTGGITRAKRHQIGIKGDVAPCPKCPPAVREELWVNLQQKTTTKKLEKEMFMSSCGTVDLEEEDEEEEFMPRESTLTIGGRSKKAKIGQHKGPMDLYMYQKPEETLKKRKLEKCRQSSIKDSNKELRAETIQYIARFFYQNGISFNVARSESFKLMVEAIGQYGKNLKPPSYHELRVSCLNKELEYTKKLMEYHRKQWPRYGVTIMSDGWTDRRQRSIINFLVNSPAGTMFVKSIDASAFVKTGEKLFELIDSIVEEIGEEHVVQLVTDNGSNYVAAGKYIYSIVFVIFLTLNLIY